MADQNAAHRLFDPPAADSVGPQKSSHGGVRPGSGRKPKALRYAEEVAAQEKRIVAALPELIDLLLAAARAGDSSAARYLVDRVLGRTQIQSKPIAEDFTTPWDGASAEEIAEMRRRRELSKELAPPASANKDHVRALVHVEHMVVEAETANPELTPEEVESMQGRHMARAKVLEPPPPPSPFR